MHRGYIKIYRKFLDDCLIGNYKLMALWMVLLLEANHQDKKIIWNKEELIIKRGELITGRKKLAEKTGLSERNVRTCLETLKSTNKVTIKIYSKFSLVTIINWDRYQCIDQVNDQQVTSKRPASDQQVTTNNNNKHYKHEEEYIYTGNSEIHDLDFSEAILYFEKNVWKEWDWDRKKTTTLPKMRTLFQKVVNTSNKESFENFKEAFEIYKNSNEMISDISLIRGKRRLIDFLI